MDTIPPDCVSDPYWRGVSNGVPGFKLGPLLVVTTHSEPLLGGLSPTFVTHLVSASPSAQRTGGGSLCLFSPESGGEFWGRHLPEEAES